MYTVVYITVVLASNYATNTTEDNRVILNCRCKTNFVKLYFATSFLCLSLSLSLSFSLSLSILIYLFLPSFVFTILPCEIKDDSFFSYVSINNYVFLCFTNIKCKKLLVLMYYTVILVKYNQVVEISLYSLKFNCHAEQ